MKMAVFWVFVPCSLVEFLSVGKVLRDCTEMPTRRQPSSRFGKIHKKLRHDGTKNNNSTLTIGMQIRTNN
jgi:hypothetical protein